MNSLVKLRDSPRERRDQEEGAENNINAGSCERGWNIQFYRWFKLGTAG